MPARPRLRLFDDRSPYVDRFGALLTLTGIAVVTLSLTGLGRPGACLVTDAILPSGFFGTPRPPTAFMYFSLTTVTTVGYGDLAPVSDLGRLLAMVEALIGQVFLVTLVALLVGLLGERWRTGRAAAESRDDPDK